MLVSISYIAEYQTQLSTKRGNTRFDSKTFMEFANKNKSKYNILDNNHIDIKDSVCLLNDYRGCQ